MKQLFFFVFLISFSAFSQKFDTVDSKVKNYSKLISVEKLATKINSDFNSNFEKVRAIYSWLAHNIRYDIKELYNPTKPQSYSFRYSSEEERKQKLEAIRNVIVIETLESRKAVCEGYAQVFFKLCTLLNIENEMVKGYVRNSSKEIGKPLSNSNHVWNAVKIDNTWKYFDATWGAGYASNGRWNRKYNDYFFDIPKEKLFLTHYPEETLWQLRVKRMSKEDFYNQPIFKSDFLNSNLELTTAKNGRLKINNEGFIQFKVKNLNPTQRIYFGFDNLKIAKKPRITSEKNISIIKIIPSQNSKEAYLFIDKMLALEFLIE